MDASQFRVAGKQLVDYIADYLENIRDRPVLPSVEPFYLRQLIPDEAPEEGQQWSEILKDIERVIMPGVSIPSCIFRGRMKNFFNQVGCDNGEHCTSTARVEQA